MSNKTMLNILNVNTSMMHFNFYKTSKWIHSIHPDTQAGDEDASAREPFVVWFSSPKTGETFTEWKVYLTSIKVMEWWQTCLSTEIQDFVIIPIHRAPEAAVKEIDELYDVYQNVSQLWRSNISVSQSRFPANEIMFEKRFNNVHFGYRNVISECYLNIPNFQFLKDFSLLFEC